MAKSVYYYWRAASIKADPYQSTKEQITQIFDATHMEQLKLARIENIVRASKSRTRAPRKSKKLSYA
jgi:hypothetical protein